MCDAKNSPEPAFVSLPPLMFALANQLQFCCPNHFISSGFILSLFFNVLIFHFNILKSKLPHYVKFQGKIHRIPAPIHQNLTKVRPNDPQGPIKPRPFQERGTNIAETGRFSHSAGSVCSGTKTGRPEANTSGTRPVCHLSRISSKHQTSHIFSHLLQDKIHQQLPLQFSLIKYFHFKLI